MVKRTAQPENGAVRAGDWRVRPSKRPAEHMFARSASARQATETVFFFFFFFFFFF
jgi:hypothetical protein